MNILEHRKSTINKLEHRKSTLNKLEHRKSKLYCKGKKIKENVGLRGVLAIFFSPTGRRFTRKQA